MICMVFNNIYKIRFLRELMGLKKGALLVSILFFSIFLLGSISAENLSEIDENAELERGEGITPDSVFYFIDEFFDRFADEVKIREEKVAEIRAMIEEGNFEAAREALENYKKYAEDLEREVSPEQRDEARRSAAAIYNVLKSLENQIPEEDRKEFIDDVLEREGRIVTAAEIASKIKELCEQLSDLDPLEYSRACKINDDSPDWQKKLHRDLTEEQKQEAKEFFEIMSQCFETSGETCRCEDISVAPFAEKCSVIAPLAFACDVQNNEAACDEMDAIEEEEPIEDLLPDYLRDVLRSLEDRFEDAEFDNHAPRECREAGVTTRSECEKIMFSLNAPQECVDAFERGEIDLDNRRDAREACEAIMFQLEAPQECIDAGLTDFRDCGTLMFSLNAPQECLDAGLTGEHRSDERKCQEIVGGFGDHDRRGPSRGPGDGGDFINFDCRGIDDPVERLDCYDRATQGAHDYGERFQKTHEQEKICAERCSAEGGAWSFSSSGGCECHFRSSDFDDEFQDDFISEPHGDYQTKYSDEFVNRCALENGYVDCDGDYCKCVINDFPTSGPEVCPDVYDPVCSTGGATYSNNCFAGLEGADIACNGECPCTADTTTTDDATTDTTLDTTTDSGGDGVELLGLEMLF